MACENETVMIHFSHIASGSGDWSKKIQVDSAGSSLKPARLRRDIETHHDVYASGNWRTTIHTSKCYH
jgi:hypothetical protein